MKELRIKSGRPLLNHVLLTADKYSAEELAVMHGGIIPTGLVDQLKPYQNVLAISPRLKEVPFKIGDLVLINIERYGTSIQKKNSLKESMDEYYDKQIVYSVPSLMIDGKECLKLGDNDIEFIIDEYEEVVPEKKSKIVTPTKSKIIQ